MNGHTHEVIGAGYRYSDPLSDAVYLSMHSDPRYRVHIRAFAQYLGYKATDMFEYEQNGGLEPNDHCRPHRRPIPMS